MYWSHWKSEKNRTELNELDELDYSKAPSQMNSYAHIHTFLYLHAQTCFMHYVYISYWSHLKWEKNRTELNELNELKYSTSQMSSYAHIHAFLYLHA